MNRTTTTSLTLKLLALLLLFILASGSSCPGGGQPYAISGACLEVDGVLTITITVRHPGQPEPISVWSYNVGTSDWIDTGNAIADALLRSVLEDAVAEYCPNDAEALETVRPTRPAS